MYSGYQAVELKYCFGMAIHPCKKPVNLHLYIDIPAQDIHFQKNVDNSNDLRITGNKPLDNKYFTICLLELKLVDF